MINNKFLYFKSQAGFERHRRVGDISNDSIVFIQDKRLIWTHGQYFGLSTGFERAKGYFGYIEDLEATYPSPEVGDWAIIGTATINGELMHMVIAQCSISGIWTLTGQLYDREVFDVDQYVKKTDLDLSRFLTQNDLRRYITITDLDNIQRLLYLLVLAAISANTITVDSSLSSTSENPVQNKVIWLELIKKLESSDLTDYAKRSEVIGMVNGRILEILNSLRDEDYNINEDLINSKIQEVKDLVDEIKEKYISWLLSEEYPGEYDDPSTPIPDNGGSNTNTRPRMITMSDKNYQALVNAGLVDNDTYYFTYSAEEYPDTWAFGGKFPITFTEPWEFGDNFPINLK